MSHLGEDEYINMAFGRRVAPPNDLDLSRNLFAIQSALVRGDVEVILHNSSTLNPAMKKRLRRTHPENTDHARHHVTEFWEVYGKATDHLDQDKFRNMFKDVRWNGLRFEFVKIFGAGGFAAATLWKVHLEGGITEKVVIKSAASSKMKFDPKEEAYWHRRYHGNRHTVQIMDLASLAKNVQDEFKETNPGKPIKYNGGVKFEAKDYEILVLEYMCHGNLFEILNKASLLDEDESLHFPSRVLWGIWECFVRGLAVVAYQPTFTQERGEVFEEELDQARQENRLDEFFNMLEKEQVNHDVHFDLEETNILAGESSDHPNQPVFKLHDFGNYSYNMNRGWETWNFKDYWRRRHLAKMTRLLPEQVHSDWDKIPTHEPWEEAVKKFQGEDLTMGHPIAGRYGSWSNMEAVITMIYIAHPFNTREYTTLDGKKTANTYGWRLVDDRFQDVSTELRDIICQCLFERPIDRPSIVSLLRQIEERKEKGFGQSDASVKKFWETFFSPQPERPIRPLKPQIPPRPQAEEVQSAPQPDTQWSEFILREESAGRRPPPPLSRNRPRGGGPAHRGVQRIQNQPLRDTRDVPGSRQPTSSHRLADYRRAQVRGPEIVQPTQYRGIQGPATQHVAPGLNIQPAPQSSAHHVWHPRGYPPTNPQIQQSAFNLPPAAPSPSAYHHTQGSHPGSKKQYRAPPSGAKTGTYRGVQYNQPRPPQWQQKDHRPVPQRRRQYQAAARQQAANPRVPLGHRQENPGPSGQNTGYMMMKIAMPDPSDSSESGNDTANKPADANLPNQARFDAQQIDFQFDNGPRAGLYVIPEADEPAPAPKSRAIPAATVAASTQKPRTAIKDTQRSRPSQASQAPRKRTRHILKSKSKRKPRPRPAAITAYVERALPDMPVAIQNLWVRSQQLDERLKRPLSDELGHQV